MSHTIDELQRYFQTIEASHAEKLCQGNIKIDPWLQPDSGDSRLGVTLIIPIGSQFKNYPALCSHYQPFQDSLYLYRHEDLHITLFDIFPAVTGFQISDSQLNKYCQVLCELFQEMTPFTIDLTGVLFTDIAGLIKGFDCFHLHHLRQAIRKQLTAAGLPFHERYESRIGHLTFCRYKNELTHPHALQHVNQTLREHFFDTLNVTNITLVIHDCYNLKSKTKVVADMPLAGSQYRSTVVP
ncbi:hypothetical protein J4G65_05975 [Aeromonas allosaccharophila]|uniref:2'-5' RNA ligase family protein n=1 Tax=Aeromonas allosaccharophila TaxID=656 RepID=UPI001BCC1952|nr:hypothetical protein [Aeromonas allosaccharophila]MBS4695027.1 hypothetical protein [Aeromonas allosaccharophila]